MLKRIVSTLIGIFVATTAVFGQVPENIRTISSPNTGGGVPEACVDQSAGTTTRTLGVGAKTTDKHFLCYNDSLLVRHNGNANLTNDPVAGTPPGIGYGFYNCKPTVTGQWQAIKADPCTNHSPQIINGTPRLQTDSMWVARGAINGDVNFVNVGFLQSSFNAGRPVKFYFAPLTIDNFAGGQQEATNTCAHASVNDGIPADTFAVVYLNKIEGINQNYPSILTGTFTARGGLPEYDGTSNYTITIRKTTNPAVVGTITSGAPTTHNGNVTFTVPETGTYRITITDGKSCDASFVMNFPSILAIASNERAAATGDTVCVSITAQNFTNVSAFQSNFTYNPAVVSFVEVRDLNLPELTAAGSFNLLSPGVLVFSWARTNPNNGVTRTPTDVLFKLCFRAVGAVGTNSPIVFSDTTIARDAANSSGQTMGVGFRNGSVVIGGVPLTLTLKADSVRCNGDRTGGLRIITAGTSTPVVYNWARVGGVETGNGNFNNSPDSIQISNLPAGNYSVTATSALGEVRTATIVIGQPASLFINPPFAVNPRCFGDSTGQLILRNGTYGGGTAPFTFQWKNTAGTVLSTTTSVANLPQGSYRIVMTDARGCRDSSSGSIGVNPIVLSNIVLTTASCAGLANGSIQIGSVTGGHSATGQYGFAWRGGPTTRGASAFYNNLNPGRYYVSVTDDSACVKIDSFTVTAARTLSLLATITNVTCAGQRNGIVNVSVGATGIQALPYTYTWTGAGTPTNGATTTRVINLAGGNYPLSVRDNDGCRIDSTFRVAESDSIRLDTINVRNESCTVGSDGTATVRVTGGTPYFGNRYRYRWSRSATDTLATISNLVAGNYTVTVTDSVGCVRSLSVAITSPPLPIVDSAVVVRPSCWNSTNGSIRLFARPATGGGAITGYTWSNGTTGALDSNLVAGLYRYTVTAADGCLRRDSVLVIAPDTLKVNTTLSQNTNPSCPTESTGSIVLVMTGGTRPFNFAWSGGPSRTASVFASLLAGNYTFTITDANGCMTNYAATLVDPPKINVIFSDLEAVSCYGKCNPGDGRATILANGGTQTNGQYNFLWASGESTNLTPSSSRAVRLCQGWQRVQVSDNACGQTDSVFIPSPDSFRVNTPIIRQPTCAGDADGSVQVNVLGGSAPYRYQWSTGTSLTNFLPNVVAGDYQVTTTDFRGCTFTFSINITEPDSLKIKILDTATTNVRCFGETNGRITVAREGGNAGPTRYTWSGNVSRTDVAVQLRSGVYSITATDEKGCADSISYVVTQPDPIFFSMPRPIPPRCNGSETDIIVDTAFGGYNRFAYVFSVDNFPPIALRGRFPVYGGRHIVSIIETNSGCKLDTIINIAEPPAIRIDFDSISNNPGLTRIVVGLGDSVRLNPRVFNDDGSRVIIDTVRWSPMRYLSFDAAGGILRPFVRPLEDSVYTLTVYDINGCIATETVLIELDRNRNVFIPNTFSPNGDDRNDRFAIQTGAGIAKINYFRIYDRWGEVVFNKQNIPPNNDVYTYGWDGTFRGSEVQPGVFVFLAEIVFEDGKILLYRGDVTLLR
ncbi:MAG: hypothetical protein RL757_715 [Bacteroidota bacterium]|jgi:gliding motility-associated-like protein